MRRAHVGHRPDVDRLRAVVGDDGLGLGESHEATDGENAADHDVDRVWGVYNASNKAMKEIWWRGLWMIGELMANSMDDGW
jgi:hypothetical protein